MDNNLTPEELFLKIQEAQAKTAMPDEPKPRELTPEENRKMEDGFAIEETLHTLGWTILENILQHMSLQHVDPRGLSESDWKFAELNAFWHGEVAKEFLESINDMVNEAHELQRIKLGEVQPVKRMRI